MDDRFLHELNEEPRPEFAGALRERLRATERPRRGWAPGATPALAAAFAVVLAVALFTLPSVRASATAMLDLFRVRRFAAIGFDESRMEKLKSLESADGLMVFDRHEKLRDPGPPQYHETIEEAAADLGMRLHRPTFFPNGLKPDSVVVNGAAEARVSVSESKLRALLQQLDLGDVKVPADIDGKWIQVKTSPLVVQKFKGGAYHAGLVQAESPEVSVPAGMDVERLAEIGLRVLGLDAGEAQRIAKATDWRTTLVVPVPMNASSFRQVTVHGQPGLLITTTSRSGDGKGRDDGKVAKVVMWTENDRVFGLMSNLPKAEAMQMAESVR